MTMPEAQVPPVIVKTPVPTVLVMVGAAVSVNGPAVAPAATVLVTVMVPVLAEVTGVPVNAGVGPVNPAVAPVTMNATALVLLPAVVTMTVRVELAAALAIVNVAVVDVLFTTTKWL